MPTPSHDDLTLCKQLVEAALDSGDAFLDTFDEAGLPARRQKVKDLFLLLSALSAVFLRLPWPVQRHRPRSDTDIVDLVQRVQAAADPSLLNPELCRAEEAVAEDVRVEASAWLGVAHVHANTGHAVGRGAVDVRSSSIPFRG